MSGGGINRAPVMHAGWLRLHPRTLKYARPARGTSLDDGTFATRLRTLSTHSVNILRSRCEGLASPAIARRYGVSEQTVKNHFTLIFRKLGLAGDGKSARACYLLGEYDAEGRKARRLVVVSARRGLYGEAA